MAGTLSAEQAKTALAQDKNIILVDIRAAWEYEKGHIAGSINVPLEEIAQIEKIVCNRNTTIFLYCQTGKHSGCARSVLMYMGYKNVWNIGGARDWPFGLVY